MARWEAQVAVAVLAKRHLSHSQSSSGRADANTDAGHLTSCLNLCKFPSDVDHAKHLGRKNNHVKSISAAKMTCHNQCRPSSSSFL